MFRMLPPGVRRRLAAAARVVHFAKNDRLFSESDPAESFYTVAAGLVKVFKVTPSNREIIVQLAGPGDPVGAGACYEGSSFFDFAMALEPTDCLVVDRPALFAVLDQEPSLARVLLLAFGERLTALMTQAADLATRPVSSRLARSLLKLCAEIGRPERRGTLIAVPLSHRELAGLAGTSVATSIRIMSRWRKQGIVRAERDGLLILDPARLHQLTLV